MTIDLHSLNLEYHRGKDSLWDTPRSVCEYISVNDEYDDVSHSSGNSFLFEPLSLT